MVDIKEFEVMSKLKLTEDERQWVSEKVDMFIESFRGIEEIDTENVKPLYTVLDIKNVLREDKAVKMISREELLSNAPEQYEGYFQVPRTLE